MSYGARLSVSTVILINSDRGKICTKPEVAIRIITQDMEDTMKAMLFSESIIRHLTEKEHIEYKSPYPSLPGSSGSKDCPEEVGIAVHSLIKAKEEYISECVDDILSSPYDIFDEHFAQLALEAAPLYFPDGYTPETFLGYCAMVMGVGLLWVRDGKDTTLLRYVSNTVSQVLTGFILSNEFQEEGGYQELIVTCTLFNHAFARVKSAKAKKRNKKKSKTNK